MKLLGWTALSGCGGGVDFSDLPGISLLLAINSEGLVCESAGKDKVNRR